MWRLQPVHSDTLRMQGWSRAPFARERKEEAEWGAGYCGRCNLKLIGWRSCRNSRFQVGRKHLAIVPITLAVTGTVRLKLELGAAVR